MGRRGFRRRQCFFFCPESNIVLTFQSWLPRKHEPWTTFVPTYPKGSGTLQHHSIYPVRFIVLQEKPLPRINACFLK